MDIFITAFLLGIIGGIAPGPILSGGFLTIITDTNGFKKVIPYPFIAGSIEIIIGIVILKTGQLLFTDTILKIFSIIGSLFMFYLAYKLFSMRGDFSFLEDKDDSYIFISYPKVALLTLLNVPLYMFWIIICIPLAFNANIVIPFGDIIFTLIMVGGVAITTIILFYLMSISRRFFQNKMLLKILPIGISIFFIGIGVKIFYSIF